MSTKIVIKEDVAADTPSSGKVALYAKSDGYLYSKDDAGVETRLSGGSGDVVGPASSTNNAIARFDGTDGVLLDNSLATIDDSGNIAATNLSGTNTGDVSLAAVGSSPNGNGASLSGQQLNLQPADGTNPGLITAGAQTIGGAKTFSGAISASNLSGTNTGDQTITLTGDVTGSGTGSFATAITSQLKTITLMCSINGFGDAITTGVKGELHFDFPGTIQQITLLADQTGSIEVDILKTTYTNFPASFTSITASAIPTISAAQKSQDSTLTGWTTAISAGDVLRFTVNSASTITRLFMGIKILRT